MPKPSNLATTYGIGIGKNGFHLVALDRHGAIVERARLSRVTILALFATARLRSSAWKPVQARNGWHAS
jgi:hypothetical protein